MIEYPHPDPPRPAFFDPAADSWILSRFADVTAALQHPQLWPVGGRREIEPEGRDQAGRIKLRADVLARFSQSQIADWRAQMELEARRMLEALPRDRPVDLFREFTLPWGLTLAMLATGADPADRDRLGALSTRVFAATGAADDSPERADAALATAELDRASSGIPMGEPTFVALSQTMPRLLTNVWLALVLHPAEYAKLRATPDLLPGAVEELLRYAGIVRRVFRRSTAKLDLGGAAIEEGQLLTLKLASANRDPIQFPEPNRLDLSRPAGAHVSLGAGRNACLGAMPLRMALAASTAALVSTFSAVTLTEIGSWQQGSSFWFPASVNVLVP